MKDLVDPLDCAFVEAFGEHGLCDMLFSFFFKSKVEQSRGEENPKPKQRERAEEPILSTLCCDTTNTLQSIQHTVTPLPNGYFHFISFLYFFKPL